MVLRIMLLEFEACRAVSRLVRFGIAPRAWLTLQETVITAKEQAQEVGLMKPPANPATASYGNRHGRFGQSQARFN